MNESLKNKSTYPTLLFWPDQALKIQAEPVKSLSEVTDFIEPMVSIMKEEEGVGLAGPQIGLLKQLIVWLDQDERTNVLINPKVQLKSGISAEPEGCLSLPGVSVVVPRPERVVVSGHDARGAPIRLDLNNRMAKILSHEIDHLNGILIIDYLKPEMRALAEEKIRETILKKSETDQNQTDSGQKKKNNRNG